MHAGQTMDRRGVLRLAAALGGGAAFAALGPVRAAEDADEVAIRALKPGQFVWYPERSPKGMVAIVVALPDQRCFVYRNGVRIGVTAISSGREGHLTPTGVFTILAKDVDHHSSLYNEASMPYSERLTWSGVALHAGGLPGYPSSHGCVHLPLAFAKLLYGVTEVGTPVIISDGHNGPEDVLDPGLVLPQDIVAALESGAEEAGAKAPNGTGGPISVVASGSDRRIIVLRSGVEVLSGALSVQDPGKPLGNVVYLLNAPAPGQPPRWMAVSFEGGGNKAGVAQEALSRIVVEPAINRQLAALLVPGATLLVTDLPADPGTRSGPDFVIMNPHGTV
ncbi:L,D-transpeptidase [Azorhizobium doebereinerae]|uniref:L,D-transpeptidase n=1 Tax=Azorhizobium doebereinerae TaxID=281091 RepID=UPI0004110C37|nr:L,D-transpeptidase [Azorhizobium doebereinerae]